MKRVENLCCNAVLLSLALMVCTGALAQSAVAGLIEQQHCMFCHTTEGADLAPSFPKIAQRYRTSPGASVMLEKKLLAGGKPHWGDITMPEADPVPPLSSDDAHVLIQWVLHQ
ncbi:MULTISPECIES: c-type cytochrome [Paraburkholderia]|uniref:C-type cytochrome n=1 Tax=Paraburkholderia madseniana TaxID=2599607 RepID=A0AAP5B722_9BURK|nr:MULTISPECIES: c-type cytochrome [Paraburkholderia]MCX4144295.1 c-type cytochrome [Paraburkholderia madseniana]MDN7147248.1 c-type cytochrome [Paraburkholderia sp. WS6]MDQ6406128.1 c-type cytochrome [Paraburkholderia madseniana]